MKRKTIKNPSIVTGGFYVSPDKSNAVIITTQFEDETKHQVYYSEVPDECPICHKGIDVRIILAYRKVPNADIAQVIFQCPRQDCLSFFIGYYNGNPNEEYYSLSGMRPTVPKDREFSGVIKSISSQFVKIYNEASYAELLQLTHICGAGYRKALEFLIKDYVTSRVTDEQLKQIIREKFLADIIKNHIDNPMIKDNAERATWLGNDETHYLRLWNDKDLEDLKRLIELTVRWVEMVEMSREYKDKMPSGKKIKKIAH